MDPGAGPPPPASAGRPAPARGAQPGPPPLARGPRSVLGPGPPLAVFAFVFPPIKRRKMKAAAAGLARRPPGEGRGAEAGAGAGAQPAPRGGSTPWTSLHCRQTWGWTAGNRENGLPSPGDANHQPWMPVCSLLEENGTKASSNYGPRATCGPQRSLIRPARFFGQ
uniref:Solute carrier family 22 member 4 n=1 Tax=Pipistrellus kuhlii TaxID=59472 RepID=A0A7J7XDC7_PIPKU|nr:solute carrier family 22 member 4 [Pipistrellus kuhlii]